jgi:hypothetical protein
MCFDFFLFFQDRVTIERFSALWPAICCDFWPTFPTIGELLHNFICLFVKVCHCSNYNFLALARSGNEVGCKFSTLDVVEV